MPTCELQLLAKDGVYLNEMPREVRMIHLFPGSRSDVAVRCFCDDPPCSASLKSSDTGIWDNRITTYEGDVLELIIDGTPVSSENLSTVVVNRPCYLADLMGATVAEANKHSLDLQVGQGGGQIRWNTGAWFTLGSDMPQNDDDLIETALGQVPVGEIIEIELNSVHQHPFHMHVNHFQLFDATSVSDTDHAINSYYQLGDWHDTILHTSTPFTIRYPTDRFTGEQVLHCHFLEHEDQGMMGWLWITGEDETVFPESEEQVAGTGACLRATGR